VNCVEALGSLFYIIHMRTFRVPVVVVVVTVVLAGDDSMRGDLKP
jgi:hypothetical protein